MSLYQSVEYGRTWQGLLHVKVIRMCEMCEMCEMCGKKKKNSGHICHTLQTGVCQFIIMGNITYILWDMFSAVGLWLLISFPSRTLLDKAPSTLRLNK